MKRLVYVAVIVSSTLTACSDDSAEQSRSSDAPTASCDVAPSTAAGGPKRARTFWATIDGARRAVDCDPSGIADSLSETLEGLSKPELMAFQREFVAQSLRTYTWRHGGAAELVCGFLSDDTFTDFRSWMIVEGRRTYDAFVADPDTLADVATVEYGCEADGEFVGYAAAAAYELLGGDPLDLPSTIPDTEPAGPEVPDDQARTDFPRTAARYPEPAFDVG